MGPEGEDIELCKFTGKACPLVKTLSAAVAVLVFTLGFYIPWINSEIKDAQTLGATVSGIESKVDMVLLILKGEMQIVKGD